MPDEATIREALKTVHYPGFSRDIISFGLVKNIAVDDDGGVRVDIAFATRDPKVPQQIYKEARQTLEGLDGVKDVHIEFDIQEPPQMQAGQSGNTGGNVGASKIPGVKKVIAVASGKGGVGKSTVSTNLALALQRTGAKVGLCDCDLYGPSIAHMFGTNDRPMANQGDQIIPVRAQGLQLMSMGFLLEDSSPVIVRGPMATRYTQQFLRNVAWDELDYLILDLPPGTGDIQLTIVQSVALDGAVIVTTPQEVALIDARKAASMFGKVNVPILGIVENMSYFLCPSDGQRYDIFGKGGGEREAKRLDVDLLGTVPIDIATREGGDEGRPIALLAPDQSPVSAEFTSIAEKITAALPVES